MHEWSHVRFPALMVPLDAFSRMREPSCLAESGSVYQLMTKKNGYLKSLSVGVACGKTIDN